MTPVYRAAAYGRMEVLRLLLDRGANKDAPNKVRHTHSWCSHINHTTNIHPPLIIIPLCCDKVCTCVLIRTVHKHSYLHICFKFECYISNYFWIYKYSACARTSVADTSIPSTSTLTSIQWLCCFFVFFLVFVFVFKMFVFHLLYSVIISFVYIFINISFTNMLNFYLVT